MAAGSRVPGFYRLSIDERRRELTARAALSAEDMRVLDGGGLDPEIADRMVENVIGIYSLPVGLALTAVGVLLGTAIDARGSAREEHARYA